MYKRQIRETLAKVAAELNTRFAMPSPELCTDNGAMIAWAGAERLSRGMRDRLDFSPRARWPLDPSAAASANARA